MTDDEPRGPTTLAHFRILGVLGQGGMGVVYRAEDEALRRVVALKVLPEAGGDEEGKHRFLREARSAASITHANVGMIYQVGEAQGRLYIAMELVPGENLRDRLARGRLDVATARELALQIARGLAAAHESGIVHRDLKPENVMITPAGVVKLLDFGLAKWGKARPASDRTSDAALAKTETLVTSDQARVLGTPEYMSPEQALGEPVDVRSDVFAFGVLLYEMLAGARPFGKLTKGALLVAVARDPPRPLREVAPNVDDATAALVMRCLEKAPAARFADAVAIVAALSGQSPLTTTQSLRAGAPSAPSTTRRRQRIAILAPFAAPLILATVLGMLALSRHPSRPAPSVTPSAAPAHSVTRIVDLPPPRTAVPAAGAEYASGIQAIHDDNWTKAEVHFRKAVDLDPTMAAAHLRLSMTHVGIGDPVTRRSEFEKAAGLRAQLSGRDQALMEALQPLLQQETQDAAEAGRRLRVLTEKDPTDAELWMWMALIHHGSPDAVAPARHAIELDPNDGQSWETLGLSLLASGNTDDARAALERCGTLSVDGADCFLWMGWADSLDGRCADYARDARKTADRNPMGLAVVLWALASTDASRAALEETLAQWVPTLPPSFSPELQRLGFATRLAILRGDFNRAKDLAQEESATLARDAPLNATYNAHYLVTMQLVDIAIETGDDAALRSLARDFGERSSAWQGLMFGSYGVDLSLYLTRLTFPAREPAPAEFERTRRAWIDKRLAAGAYRGDLWNYAYASPALSVSEAEAALRTLAELGPRTPSPVTAAPFAYRVGSPEADTGRVYLLAGRTDEAIAHLERAAAQCDVLSSTLDHMHATFDLGWAREQKGDRPRACEAYAAVLARWGHATPRSVTADAARTHASALGCGAR